MASYSEAVGSRTLQSLDEARPFVRAVARGYLASREDVEDAVQEVVLRAYRAEPTLRCPNALRAWLREITRNVCLNMRRSDGRRRERIAEEPEYSPLDTAVADGAVECAVLEAWTRREVARAVRQLPDRYADPLLLVACQGLSCRDAADRLGVPVGTLKVRVHRARRMLATRACGVALAEILESAAA